MPVRSASDKLQTASYRLPAMFQQRVKLLLLLFAVPALAVVARLAQLQVLGAAAFREATEKMLELPPKQFPCLRGRILDRRGRILACDAPAWDIAVHYGAMVDDPGIRKRMCKRIDFPIRDLTDEKINDSWLKIAQLTVTPLSQLQKDRERIVGRVKRIKQYVSEHRGVETAIEEENQAHPIVSGLDQSQQVAARVALAEYPWIEIVSSHRRVYQGGTATAQIIGSLGRVTDAALENDPNADDPLGCYKRVDDVFGVQGVEAMAEQWLRGRRGQTHDDRLKNELSPPIEATDGRDVRLTLDLALQEAIYRIWTRSSIGTGGCAVILDIPTREVLAMVGYPAVDVNNREEMARIDPDDPRQPYLFRAVRANYHPGSIVKPVILAGGLMSGLVNHSTVEICAQHLLPGQPEKWRCTGLHGPMNAVAALQHSCNIYFYRLGQQLGVNREVEWFRQFGLGQVSGTGLIEEFRGRLPVTKNDGQARLAAIGQSETELTPIQAANLIATVASGVYRPASLWANNPAGPGSGRKLPVSDAAWDIIREGLYDVVNERGGTAFTHFQATGADFGPYVLMGKTGSAEPWPPEWFYTITFSDGRRQEVRASNMRAVLEKYPDVKVSDNKRIPPEYEPTHGWFVGYLAPRGRHLRAVESGPAGIAIAVIVEYAGHGGEVAVPMVAEMLQAYLYQQERYAQTTSGGAG